MKVEPKFSIKMIATSCLVLALVCSAASVPIQKFYPFGTENNDLQLPKWNQDAYSSEIQLQVPVKFFSNEYTSLFMNSNGLISFLTPIPQFINMQFPLDYPVIAALYAHVDIRTSGAVYYRETNNKGLLNRFTQDVRLFFPNSGSRFQATSLFIATWHKVGYYNQKNDKVNTYQVIIASSNEESYVEFLYADDGIQWLQGDGLLHTTGLPDAKAQAGLVAANGRYHVLQGSGTDQARSLMKLSNANEPGLWAFKVGPYDNNTNVEEPIFSKVEPQYATAGDQIISCAIGYNQCHSQATCIDTSKGFCCTCRRGFYGNGYNCLKDGTPLRAGGKVTIDVNGIKIDQVDLQAYIVIQDGRAYVAISQIPSTIGVQLQLLYPMTSVLNWLFAKPIGNGLNGFQITGGSLNYTAEMFFKGGNERITITQKYYGLDPTDQLKMDVNIKGTVPQDRRENTLVTDEYQQQFNFVSRGVFQSSSTLGYKKQIISTGQEEQYEISLDQTIQFNESCILSFNNISEKGASQRTQFNYFRVKTMKNFITYENRENILRFAATSKVSLLTETDDPCIEGRVKCVANSSCVVEGDSFKCICNPGFQTTYFTSKTTEFGCLDVNECAEGKATCDPNALCINEVGSYQCLCKPGYSGNGYFCTEIESPCVKNPASCTPPNSQCSDYKDPRTCECQPGYQKQYLNDQHNGFVCMDVNECEYDSGSICGPNADCINTQGGYLCSCHDGYVKDRDATCQRKDASCNVLRNCSPNGECIYNETSSKYVCRCIRGYYGDGYVCQQIGGRRVVSKICTSGVCVCPTNYVAFDNYCIENEFMPTENAISCNTISSMCHPQAQCVYNANTQKYNCICTAGFEGNGLECEASCLRNNFCDEHASCITDPNTGKAQCVCHAHYQGDGLQCIHAGMCNSDGDCEENEECGYNEDSYAYECKCRAGYVKHQNTTCRLVSRCPACHQYAICVNEQCNCLPGYKGDGVYSCRPTNSLSCISDGDCAPNAICAATGTTYDSLQCKCKHGYTGNGTHCQRILTCAIQPQLCDVNARCIAGQFNTPFCECNPGFVGNGSHCTEIEKQEGGFLLVNHGTSTLRLNYQENATKTGNVIHFQADQIAIGLAVDCVEGKIYWSDYIGKKIKSSNYKGKNIQSLVNSSIGGVEGLTVDWLGRKLYWTDSTKRIIESINLDGTERKTIISTGLLNPRGITVHPYKRKLFWTDWNREKPKIEYSNLDGTERSVFLSGADVKLPNSVTVDFALDEVCWADTGTRRISCAGIDSKLPRVITPNVTSPFGLTVSTEKYFWTDWNPLKVGYYDRYSSKSDTLQLPVGGSGTLYGIVAVPNNCP